MRLPATVEDPAAQRNFDFMMNRWGVKFGLAADRPAPSPDIPMFYYATDTSTMSVTDGVAWHTV